MLRKFFIRRGDSKPSLTRKLFLALGSIGAILLLSSVISILEYRRMSSYVSELIASNIRSINLSQSLADLTQEYNHQMLAVVVQNDISVMPDFDLENYNAQSDSLRVSLTSQNIIPFVDTLDMSFDEFIATSMKFDEIFLADSVDTGVWFFGTLQPAYNRFRTQLASLNEQIHDELQANSNDFDDGFYRSVMPGIVAIGAGLVLVMLLFYFMMSYYVKPIYRISDGLAEYRKSGRKHVYTFDGDDQLAEINTSVTELIDENIELKQRVRKLREEREMNL